MQLNQFQRNRRRLAFVVDEYGDIQGFVTLEDILEEIVGEFTTDPATVTHKHVHREAPGRVHHQRERDRPRAQSLARLAVAHRRTEDAERTAGRKTRDAARGRRQVAIGEYQFEVLQIGENTIRTVRARKQPAPAAD